jgi:DNA-binding LacI/PurR family transcriptional regulator
VSRTINRIPTVDPVPARPVWRASERVGYYPNTHAGTPVSGRSRIFGLVVPEITHPCFFEIVQTFTELGIQHQYEILLSFLAQDSLLVEKAVRQSIERRVDATIKTNLVLRGSTALAPGRF